MGINKAIQVAAIIAILLAATGQLPRAVKAVQIAQLRLLKESQSASWGKALVLPMKR
jgi:hypothetical protein